MTTTVKHVLLVEDNPAHARLIRAHLEDFIGLTIDWVQRGEEAMDYLFGRNGGQGQRLPDLILLDLKLPGINGPEVLQRLRGDDRLRRIPVVVLTSSRDSADMDQAYANGANSYLVKSTDFAGMQEMLHHAVAFWCEWNQLPRSD
jgi:two-component system, response regulator